MQVDRRFYVYLHRRKTDGSVFYVGKGQRDRAASTSGRNAHWHNVAKKNGWYPEIFRGEMTECCAFTLEKIMISLGGGKLTNRASGGQGASGVIHTDETKAKFRAAKIGRKQSPEHAAKSRVAKIGKKQSAYAISVTKAIRSRPVVNCDGEVFPSSAEAARIMSERTGRAYSQGNIGRALSMGSRTAYGKKWRYA